MNSLQALIYFALDCYDFRGCNNLHKKLSNRCIDAPHIKGEAPTLPSLPGGIVLPTKTLEAKTMSPYDASARPNLSTADAALQGSPKQILLKWYKDYWRRVGESSKLSYPSVKRRLPENDSYATWSNNSQVKGPHLFTSVFVCPWTGERFLSGKLIDKQMEYFVQNFMLGVQGSEEGGEVRSLVWYSKFL